VRLAERSCSVRVDRSVSLASRRVWHNEPCPRRAAAGSARPVCRARACTGASGRGAPETRADAYRGRRPPDKEPAMNAVPVRRRPLVLATATAALAGAAMLVGVGSGHADSTPIGPLPAGSVATTSTRPGQLVAVALPR